MHGVDEHVDQVGGVLTARHVRGIVPAAGVVGHHVAPQRFVDDLDDVGRLVLVKVGVIHDAQAVVAFRRAHQVKQDAARGVDLPYMIRVQAAQAHRRRRCEQLLRVQSIVAQRLTDGGDRRGNFARRRVDAQRFDHVVGAQHLHRGLHALEHLAVLAHVFEQHGRDHLRLLHGQRGLARVRPALAGRFGDQVAEQAVQPGL